MRIEHVKLVKEVLTKACNGQHVYEFEYGLALLACSEAIKEAERGAPHVCDGTCAAFGCNHKPTT